MNISKNTWQSALDTQSACNLSGINLFLTRALKEMRASGITDTDALNTHPITRLVVGQMAYLAFGHVDDKASDAISDACATAIKEINNAHV